MWSEKQQLVSTVGEKKNSLGISDKMLATLLLFLMVFIVRELLAC